MNRSSSWWTVAVFLAALAPAVAVCAPAGPQKAPPEMRAFFARQPKRHRPPESFRKNFDQWRRRHPRPQPKEADPRPASLPFPVLREIAHSFKFIGVLSAYFKNLTDSMAAQQALLADRARIMMKAPGFYEVSPPYSSSVLVPDLDPNDYDFWPSTGGGIAAANESTGVLLAGATTWSPTYDGAEPVAAEAYAIIGVLWEAPRTGRLSAKVWFKNQDYTAQLTITPGGVNHDLPLGIMSPGYNWVEVRLMGGCAMLPLQMNAPQPADTWHDELLAWVAPAEQVEGFSFYDGYGNCSYLPSWMVHPPYDNFPVCKGCQYYLWAGVHTWAVTSSHGVTQVLASVLIDRMEVTITPLG